MADISKIYETRRKTERDSPPVRSKVDWRRTKKDIISLITDSDECSTTSEEDGYENEDVVESVISSEEKENEQHLKNNKDEDKDEESIVLPKRKRKTSVMYSDSDSDSDVPIGKVLAKRRHIINEDDEPCEDGEKLQGETAKDEAAERKMKKQRNFENLKQLAQRRRTRSQSKSWEELEDSECDTSSYVSQDKISENEYDSMEDFIDNDEDENTPSELEKNKQLFPKHLPMLYFSDLQSHFQRIIKALLISVIDKGFLSTLYKGMRKKRYARDMLDSLDYIDKRVISPRLVNLHTRSRWSNRYKERVETYPYLSVHGVDARDQSCQACELHRHCRFLVILSGPSYKNDTLEKDEFMSNDKQELKIGNVCTRRTEAYHQLKHFKYHLYESCMPEMDEIKSRLEDKPAKEIVECCLFKMESEGFIKENVKKLEQYLDIADNFQQEMVNY
ncbi:coiled-coil domain-containing protein 82 [Spea bombifrons]|uniref:coiled-coil domain-containing protein 82 n=1 Tax=Spea bombifrons TaxID=233779 RepID=UPI00234A727D|nr:coiled-coil domain-containing protein 82 [Spea bombifrons]